MPKIIYDTQWFIKKARKVHGSKYDYSKVDYKKAKIKVTLICPIHGEFQITPLNHIYNKVGCKKCFVGSLKMDTKTFIKRAKIIHGTKYNYDLVDLKNTKSGNKIPIICRRHGKFFVTPAGHLKYGCKLCSFEDRKLYPEKYTSNYKKCSPQLNGKIYFVMLKSKITNEIFCKVGLTRLSIENRFDTHIEILDRTSFKGKMKRLFGLESDIKKRFKKYQYNPTVKFSGYTECFTKTKYQIILKHFKKMIARAGLEPA